MSSNALFKCLTIEKKSKSYVQLSNNQTVYVQLSNRCTIGLTYNFLMIGQCIFKCPMVCQCVSEFSEYANILTYSLIFLTNNIHIRICSQQKLRIIFIFLFVVDQNYEYYLYSYSLREKYLLHSNITNYSKKQRYGEFFLKNLT